jgi:integrase
MNATVQKRAQPADGQPVFHKVAENLYRLESSGGYYGLIKKGGKQFRRSLKTRDRKLAERRLKDLKDKIGVLRVSDDAKCDFKTLAGHWLDSRKHKLAESTAEWYGYFIKNLGNFFGAASIRNITAQDCERWAATRRKTVGTKSFVTELDTMNAVFKYAVRHGLILANPADPIERPTVRQPKIQVPSLEEFQQILLTIRQSGGQNDVQNLSKIGGNLVELLAYSGARVAEITGGRKKKNPLIWSNVNFESNMVFLPGTKTESSPRWIPMSGELRGFLERLKAEKNPAPGDPIIPILSARKCLETACRKLGFPIYTHHDFRHFFATTCIESGVDVPTVSRWLGHCDGGALAMKRYGHLRQEHSLAMSKKVHFEAKPGHNIISLPTAAPAKTDKAKQNATEEKQAIAKCKAQYAYPWWASENSIEVFWGQLNEDVPLISREKYLAAARKAMGREVFESELDDLESLIYELVSRISKTDFERLASRIPPRKITPESLTSNWESAS